MKKSFSLALALICAFMFSGCASILSKSQYPVLVKSQPPGMSFRVTDLRSGDVVSTGITPDTIVLKSGSGYFKSSRYQIAILRDGQEVNSVQMQGEIDGWYIGNILFGGIIGLLIVDPLTGAMYKLPDEIQAYSGGGVTHSTVPTLEIRTLDSLPAELQATLVAIN